MENLKIVNNVKQIILQFGFFSVKTKFLFTRCVYFIKMSIECYVITYKLCKHFQKDSLLIHRIAFSIVCNILFNVEYKYCIV